MYSTPIVPRPAPLEQSFLEVISHALEAKALGGGHRRLVILTRAEMELGLGTGIVHWLDPGGSGHSLHEVGVLASCNRGESAVAALRVRVLIELG